MKGILTKLDKKQKSNSGESNTIAFLFTVMFLIALSITLIDTGIYFMERNVVTNAATNGARLVSVYGGTGGVEGTPIAKAYGTKIDGKCVNNANPVVCSVENELRGSPLTKATSVQSINCGPFNTASLGQRTYCEIKWSYQGVPGSALTFIKRKDATITTRISAESEVIYNGK